MVVVPHWEKSWQAFRDRDEYTFRLNRLNEAVSELMKVCEDSDDAIAGIGSAAEVEEVMLASYSMLKYVQQYMRSINIGYDEGYVLVAPRLHAGTNLSKAIGNALRIQMEWGPNKAYSLPDEAKVMESVSREAYGCLKRLGCIE